jgi:hypothetical protein
MLDVRLPIGVLCAVIGALLFGYGVGPRREPVAGLAIDTWWGVAMMLLGLAMLFGSWRHARRRANATHPRPSEEKQEEQR